MQLVIADPFDISTSPKYQVFKLTFCVSSWIVSYFDNTLKTVHVAHKIKFPLQSIKHPQNKSNLVHKSCILLSLLFCYFSIIPHYVLFFCWKRGVDHFFVQSRLLYFFLYLCLPIKDVLRVCSHLIVYNSREVDYYNCNLSE